MLCSWLPFPFVPSELHEGTLLDCVCAACLPVALNVVAMLQFREKLKEQ